MAAGSRCRRELMEERGRTGTPLVLYIFIFALQQPADISRLLVYPWRRPPEMTMEIAPFIRLRTLQSGHWA